jgi:serine phosphatase RsbU (regulator of sigma subunit)
MMLTGLLIADISGHGAPAAPPVTLIGFTGMIRDPTRTYGLWKNR